MRTDFLSDVKQGLKSFMNRSSIHFNIEFALLLNTSIVIQTKVEYDDELAFMWMRKENLSRIFCFLGKLTKVLNHISQLNANETKLRNFLHGQKRRAPNRFRFVNKMKNYEVVD